MALARSRVFIEATGLTNGRDEEFGDRFKFLELTLTNGEHYRAGSVVQDNFQEEQLWAANQGGLNNFQMGMIETDADIVVQLADAAVVSIFTIPANSYAIFGGQVDLALAGDGVADTPGDVDAITVKRNVANGVGDAYVTLTLVG